MPKFDIVPAFDPQLQCEFSIPRKGAKPLEFTVPLMKYMAEPVVAQFQHWAENFTDSEGNKAIPPDRDTQLKMLQLALPAAKFEQVRKLTHGELAQVWDVWTAEPPILDPAGQQPQAAN